SLCETPQACRGGSRATRGKRSLARKSLAVLRATLKLSLFMGCFFNFVQTSLFAAEYATNFFQTPPSCDLDHFKHHCH
ncbi:hypothetical protein AAEO50_10930, partial [Rossellomorea oryzaecorticis]